MKNNEFTRNFLKYILNTISISKINSFFTLSAIVLELNSKTHKTIFVK